MSHILVFFDPVALTLVVIGSLVLAALQEGWHSFFRAGAALPVIFRSNRLDDADLARNALVRVTRMVEKRGLSCADRVKADPPFARAIIAELANHKNPTSFHEWTDQNIKRRTGRHAFASRYWSTVADIAPALGMIGTVIGLVLMFGQVEDAAAIGRAMAVAMLTTLYGLLLSNLIAGPFAVRLIRASENEIDWQKELADGFCGLVDREYVTALPAIVTGDEEPGLNQCA